ncbi:MAG: hypothetical protein ABII75_02875 [Candidatus Omnitrophota bacterium]
MKKTISILLALSFIFITQTSFANPPKDMEITVSAYNIDVAVIHPTRDPDRHYINKIEIFVSDNLVITQKFAFQKKNRQYLSRKLPALTAGDVVKVVAYCNLSGQMERTVPVQ